ncbi:hypothetical protein FNF28_05256 [Cafeteria roenbergensis]|uniref:J domain-containing protein n=1 Tax=Cafeteria roenbergensis TaxID=33653 RepID=A0A5A8D7I7_CAFRO|nr:hypothetical protein FNF28_05256 [Cafeteria roenbergensis]
MIARVLRRSMPRAAVAMQPSRGMASHSMEALPFAVRAVDAEHIYESWCRKSTPMLRPPPITAMYTYFLPFWVFEAELTTRVGGAVYHKFADGAAMQVYGGHTFRRRMTEVLKSDASRAVPFSASMMDGMDNRVDIDEWSVFERTALDLIREQVLQEEAEIHYDQHPNQEVEVSYTRLTSRRVLMPAHIVEYEHGGATFRLFVNGVSGDAFGIEQRSLVGEAWSAVSAVGRSLKQLEQRFGPQSIMTGGLLLLRVVGSLAARLLLSPPFFVAAVVGTFFYGSWLKRHAKQQQDASYSEWAETRARELASQARMTDSWTFRPQGRSAGDRRRDRERENDSWQQHQQHRRQDRQRHQARSHAASSSSSSSSSAKSSSSKRYQPIPRVDESNPYAVLGVPRGSPTSDIQKGFRRELMRWHPDHNKNSDYDPEALQERTRIIIDSYKQLRSKSR